MLSQEGCRLRRQRLWDALPDEIEWLLVADPRHVLYLSNFLVQPLSFSHGERCWLLLERDGPTTLLGDNFSIRSAAGEYYVDETEMVAWYDHVHSVVNRDHALLQALENVAPRLVSRRGLTEREWLSAAGADLLARHYGTLGNGHATQGKTDDDATDLGSLLRQLRRQKEADEIELMRKCMVAGAAGQQRLREILSDGTSELDVYLAVQQAAEAAAGCPAIIYGDFRAVNAARPKAGGLPTDYRVCTGDMFILDYTVMLHGYRSDFTNTLVVGEPSDEQQLLYQLCMSAMEAGEKSLKAGVAAKDVHAAVVGPFHEAGYAEKFGHHAGHGIGIGHPEPPILVPDSTDTLLAGDVVTLEPGLYVEGTGGIRIEHNYLITEQGYDRLSDHLIALS